MGRRKWKVYQETVIARHPADRSPSPQSDPSAMPAAEPPPPSTPQPQTGPSIKIKTIEQINTTQDGDARVKVEEQSKPETTILEALIKRPSTHPHREDPEKCCSSGPEDWKPPDKCYFCVDGEPLSARGTINDGRGPGSPAPSESSSSCVSGTGERRTPPPGPVLLAHLLQLQNQPPQALAQLQSMMSVLTTLGGFMTPALQQAWCMRIAQQNQLLQQSQHHAERISDNGEKVSVSTNSPTPFALTASSGEQPLDLSAKSSSSSTEASASPEPRVATRVPPIDPKFHDRLKRATISPTNLASASSSANVAIKRTYTDDELQNALKDIRSGRLGTRRAAVLYGIPRSTLRNKVYKLQDAPNDDDDKDSNTDDDWPPHAAPYIRSLLLADNDNDTKRSAESPSGVILKIPTFPPPDENESGSGSGTTPVTPRPPNFFADPTPPNLPLPPLADLDPAALRGDRLYSLRDVIAESISRKFQRPPTVDGVSDLTYERNTPSRPISVIKNFGSQEPTRNSHHQSNNSNNVNNGSASNSQALGGKGTRPKRGKYRNYDRDSLVEAVKAVQRGEMSVHRAGSYYGVPHSTLEYKVKERHLMRPRKREPKNPPSDGISIARATQQSPRITPKAPVKPNPSPGPGNGLKSSGSFENNSMAGTAPFAPGAYPFWARASLTPAFPPFPSSAPELFASHMMQRLRDESTPASRSDPPSANGSFLEGIIRSSLERAPEKTNSESEGSPPPARRPRLDSSDHSLAADMREAVQRLRAERQPAHDRPDVPAHL